MFPPGTVGGNQLVVPLYSHKITWGLYALLSLSVQVAPPADGTEEVATVKLTITGDEVNVEEQKKVLICKARSGTIIQTDKPIYEPGQTGEIQMGAAEGLRLFAGCIIWKDGDALKCMNSLSRRPWDRVSC